MRKLLRRLIISAVAVSHEARAAAQLLYLVIQQVASLLPSKIDKQQLALTCNIELRRQ